MIVGYPPQIDMSTIPILHPRLCRNTAEKGQKELEDKEVCCEIVSTRCDMEIIVMIIPSIILPKQHTTTPADMPMQIHNSHRVHPRQRAIEN